MHGEMTKRFPLSKIQEQFWVLWNLAPSDTAYNIPLVYKITGTLHLQSFQLALNHVINHYDVLKSHVVMEHNIPFLEASQSIHEDQFFKLIHIESLYTQEKFQEMIMGEVHTPFDLMKDNLIRVKLFQFQDQTILTILFHHIIIDLHSKKLFISHLASTYSEIITVGHPKTTRIEKSYQEFINWSNCWIKSETFEKTKEKWLREYHHPESQLEFPFNGTTEQHSRYQGHRHLFTIEGDLTTKIKGFSADHHMTPFVVLQSAYAILLSRLCNQTDLSIGVPFSNRRNEDFADTMGCFVNILPVSVSVDPEKSMGELIKQVRLELLKTHRRQEIPYLLLNSILNSTPQTPLFQTGFTFEEPVELSLTGVKTESIVIEREGAQLDLFLTMWDGDTSFSGFWEYNGVKFSPGMIERIESIFNAILRHMVENPQLTAQEFEILPPKDADFINQFNQTECLYESTMCLHWKFEKQVDATPHAPALSDSRNTLSYIETERKANQLANYLISKGIQPGDVIAICCDRSIEMMIGILAILKTGSCYLPLSVDHPSERNNEIIRDSQARLILTSMGGATHISQKHLIVSLDQILEHPLSQDISRPSVAITSNHLAYILYTSGSTGKPKGTLIEHHSVMNRIGWMQKNYPLTDQDTLLQKTPITFDVSVWELFWWFFNGSRLVLLNPNGEKDVVNITRYIEDFAVTRIHFVPSMFAPFLYYIKKPFHARQIVTLKHIFLSGEALPASMVNEFNHLRQTVQDLPDIVNLYGPTEATVDVSYYNCPDHLDANDRIYIGKPIDNTKLFIVNSKLQIQPVGVRGELIITGVNLSRGYLNRPELTERAFVPFQEPGGQIIRAYKTGDLAFLAECAELEYTGRIDNQVKIRGMRIELGEIESHILQQPEILNCAVVAAFEGEHKTLVAYLVAKSGIEVNINELRESLHNQLPPHMVPSHYMVIEKIPLTSSGKLNRKALPEPEKRCETDPLIQPSSSVEEELLKIWQEVLQVNSIGITTNFFDVGGNSILSIKLALRINECFKQNVSVISVLEHPNIRDYSKYLNSLNDQTGVADAQDNLWENVRKRSITKKKRVKFD